MSDIFVVNVLHNVFVCLWDWDEKDKVKIYSPSKKILVQYQ